MPRTPALLRTKKQCTFAELILKLQSYVWMRGITFRNSVKASKLSKGTKWNSLLLLPYHTEAAVDISRSTQEKGYITGKKKITRSVAFSMDHKETEFVQRFTSEQNVKELVKLIIELGITHYVSKITLGATEHCTISEKAYRSYTKGKVNATAERIANFGLKASREQTSSSLVSETKRIGVMKEDTVVIEGVVDVRLESIASLITEEHLRKNLIKALNIYTGIQHGYSSITWENSNLLHDWPLDPQKDTPDGDHFSDSLIEMQDMGWIPNWTDETQIYAIFCEKGEDQLFLDIDESKHVYAHTSKERDVNYFNLERNPKIPDEFIIKGYKDLGKLENVARKRDYKFPQTFRYLKVKTHFGCHRRPLSMKDSVDMSYCQLQLRPRLSHANTQDNMAKFLNGKEKFYICTSRRHGKTGYLYLREETETQPETGGQVDAARSRYVLACKPFIDGGNLDELMLFSLVRREDLRASDADKRPTKS